jgi:hypothetical protein
MCVASFYTENVDCIREKQFLSGNDFLNNNFSRDSMQNIALKSSHKVTTIQGLPEVEAGYLTKRWLINI